MNREMSKEEQNFIKNGETKEGTEAKSDAFEAMLAHVGELGRYQKLLVLGMCPFGVLFSFVYFIQMFITLTPQSHWCRVPELSHLEPKLRRNLTAPRLGDEWDKCTMFVANWSHVLETLRPPDPATATAPCSHGWDFELTDIPYHTVVTERGWVCEYAGYVPSAQAFFFVGSFVGVIFFGWLADTHGRVPALVGATTMALIGGIATVFTTGFWDFALCRFIAGLSIDSIFMLSYILVLEYIGPRFRTVVTNTSVAVYFGAGCLMLPALALWFADWRTLVWVTTAPLALIVVVPFTVPESARWLLTRGRVDQAVKMLRKFERVNGRKIPQEDLDEFIATSNQMKPTNESLKSLLRSPPLLKMMVCLVIQYITLVVVFDVLVRISEDLGVNFFITFSLASATEIPSILILIVVLDRWGRRNMAYGPMVIAGLVTMVGTLVPKGAPLVATAVFARFLVNMAYTASVQWATELLPTSVRASGTSFIHVSGLVAVMLSPFVVYTGRVWSALPFVILTLLSLISGGVCVLLPETMGKPLPQNFEEGERIIKGYSLCRKSEEFRKHVSEDKNGAK